MIYETTHRFVVPLRGADSLGEGSGTGFSCLCFTCSCLFWEHTTPTSSELVCIQRP